LFNESIQSSHINALHEVVWNLLQDKQVFKRDSACLKEYVLNCVALVLTGCETKCSGIPEACVQKADKMQVRKHFYLFSCHHQLISADFVLDFASLGQYQNFEEGSDNERHFCRALQEPGQDLADYCDHILCKFDRVDRSRSALHRPRHL
jgi:hypothetical protein